MGRPHRLLFICTGNICRSPIAEHLARSIADRTHIELEAQSASTLGLVDRFAAEQMIAVGAEIGLDLGSHRSQPITDELVDWADHILVMEYMHAGHVAEFHPRSEGKVQLLGPFVDVEEIADPIGAWFRWTFRRCRRQLETAVGRFLETLPSEYPSDESEG